MVEVFQLTNFVEKFK